jgi:hypothetical protein
MDRRDEEIWLFVIPLTSIIQKSTYDMAYQSKLPLTTMDSPILRQRVTRSYKWGQGMKMRHTFWSCVDLIKYSVCKRSPIRNKNRS